MKRRVVRVALILTTVLSVFSRGTDIVAFLCCGDIPKPDRFVMLEVDSAVVSVLTAWYLGWYLWRDA